MFASLDSMAAIETFKRDLRGWSRSSEGYAVRLLGRTNLQYKDEFGEVHIFAEAMSKSATEIVIDTATIPDRPGRTRDDVLVRLQRVFDLKGWSLIKDDG